MSDPTRNRREEFLRAIRRRFRRVRGLVRWWVGYEEDVFGLRTDGGQPRPDDLNDDAPQVYRFQSRSENIAAFLRWLGGVVEEEVLEPIDRRAQKRGDHWTAPLLRASYAQGWKQARHRLRQAGVAVGPEPPDDELIQRIVPRTALEEIYTRTYRNLRTVTSQTARPTREILAQSLAEGVNPREAARRLTDEIESVQKDRAETLARTETVHAYTEATVSRYREAGVDTVQHGEWSDADDSRVCPICERLDGKEIPLTTIDEATFTFEPEPDQPDSLAGEYALKPPIHPGGRCVLLPVLT
jgi:SPP1 gp7 family putative phage head morphogenesis protein